MTGFYRQFTYGTEGYFIDEYVEKTAKMLQAEYFAEEECEKTGETLVTYKFNDEWQAQVFTWCSSYQIPELHRLAMQDQIQEEKTAEILSMLRKKQ